MQTQIFLQDNHRRAQKLVVQEVFSSGDPPISHFLQTSFDMRSSSQHPQTPALCPSEVLKPGGLELAGSFSLRNFHNDSTFSVAPFTGNLNWLVGGIGCAGSKSAEQTRPLPLAASLTLPGIAKGCGPGGGGGGVGWPDPSQSLPFPHLLLHNDDTEHLLRTLTVPSPTPGMGRQNQGPGLELTGGSLVVTGLPDLPGLHNLPAIADLATHHWHATPPHPLLPPMIICRSQGPAAGATSV
jgi:hypothetical protein